MAIRISRMSKRIRERNNKNKDVRKKSEGDVKMNERVNQVS
jgi:hypothetical protein